MRTNILICLLLAVLGSFIGSCGKSGLKPISVNYFKNGDTLLPDYACTDTLIVIDSKGLNQAIGYLEQGLIEGTDGDIAEVFYKYCKIK